MYRIISLFCLLVLGVNVHALAQSTDNFPPPGKRPIITAAKTITGIRLDGRLDEADWNLTAPVTDFFKMEPRQGEVIRHRSSVRVLFDDTYIYFGIVAEDSIGKEGIRVQDLRRDFNSRNNDVSGIQIDAQNLKQYSVSFQTTPYENQLDLQYFNDNNTDSDWNALWSVRTQRTDEGYTAEFAIPFKSIRYERSKPGEEISWGVTFYRLARRDYELSVFPAISQSFSPYRMTYAAELRGLELPKPNSNIRIEPYLLNQLDNIDEGDNITTENTLKLGGDIKWAISPKSVLDLTFNTDFAQAEKPNSPTASFAVGRYLQNYGNENNIGGMVTYRHDNASEALGRSSNNNTTVTVDGLIRPASTLTVSYLLSGSEDEASNSRGIAGRFFTGFNANNMYLGWLTNFVSREYDPGIGFVFQNDVVQHNPGGYYIWRPKNIPWIRRVDPGVFVNYNHDASDFSNFQQASIYFFPVYIFFTDGAFFEYSVIHDWQNINFNFAPLGLQIAEGNYQYTSQLIRFNTDQYAKLAISGQLTWGGFYNGNRTTLRGDIRYAPTVFASVWVDYEQNDLRGIGVLKEDLKTHLTSLLARFALNPRVQFSSFYQYNTFDAVGRLNARFSWEYAPLSFLYLVFNNTRIEGFELPFEEQQLIAKVTLMNQF